MAAQRAIPIPASDMAADAAAAGPPPAAPTPGPAPLSPTDPNLLEMALKFDPGVTPLGAPAENPDGPITTGLSSGPGPGREIFYNPGRANRAASVLRMLSMSSGQNQYAELADQIEGYGGLV